MISAPTANSVRWTGHFLDIFFTKLLRSIYNDLADSREQAWPELANGGLFTPGC